MKTIRHRDHREKGGKPKLSLLFFAAISVVTSFFAFGCSIPSLEKPECTQARDTVKQFYSWYLGTDVDVRSRQPEIYEKYISPSFVYDPKKRETDPYFLTNDFPKTFKIGKCEAPESNKATLQVQLYWRDDAKTVQKDLHVEAIKTGDVWLINKISN